MQISRKNLNILINIPMSAVCFIYLLYLSCVNYYPRFNFYVKLLLFLENKNTVTFYHHRCLVKRYWSRGAHQKTLVKLILESSLYEDSKLLKRGMDPGLILVLKNIFFTKSYYVSNQTWYLSKHQIKTTTGTGSIYVKLF